MFNMKFFHEQPMGTYEFAHGNNKEVVSYYTGVSEGDWSNLHVIPKKLAANYDYDSDKYKQYSVQVQKKRYSAPHPDDEPDGPSAAYAARMRRLESQKDSNKRTKRTT